ncbi:AAA family ATPase [Mycobacterium intracellulare]|uniref:AAA family ATPase n=1 Tax=Mycobacterium intracellulare TaxID=1767 RepID=UPI0034D3187F
MNESPTDDLVIQIHDCNSITEAEISLRRSSLNIKYGANGAGKSTIARALKLRAEGEEFLNQLTPFKYQGVDGAPAPTVLGAETIKKVFVFDEEYVSTFVFRPDEVLKDSFEVFINTEEYRQGLAQIDALFQDLNETFNNLDGFTSALSEFQTLRDAFNLTKTGSLAKNSKGLKAIGVAGKIAHIPEPLTGYKPFLESSDPAGWISWQAKGKIYLEQSDNCPFCSSPNLDKKVATQVSEVYESAAVKNLSALRQIIDQLGDYFEETKLKLLHELLTTLGDLSTEQISFLANLRRQVETFLEKLAALQALSFHTLRETEDVNGLLLSLKIDLPLLDALNSEKTASVVSLINGKLDEVAVRINELHESLGRQNSRVADLIRRNQRAINEFLRSAGYRYSVRIEDTKDSYRMIVEHEDSSGHLESADRHLSYGEKNAFALVLFMHHVRKEKPDLVVLDDPVSSFDKTKKFAIIHELFQGKNSIRDFTTLFLTHDIEPLIDIVYNATSAQFSAVKPRAHFLQSRSGTVRETLVEKRHITTFSQVCKTNIGSSSDDVIKCIYLRRLYEINGDRNDIEYHILSSLLHARETPTIKKLDGSEEPISDADLTAGMEKLRKQIPTLDYAGLVRSLQDPATIKAKFDATDVGYEKVQLFRVFLRDKNYQGEKALQKFVNETYHIENEYVIQLNPREFDAVPEYVIKACEDRLAEVAG